MQSLFTKFKSLSLGVRIIGLTLTIIALIVFVNNLVFINKHRAANSGPQRTESFQRLMSPFKVAKS